MRMTYPIHPGPFFRAAPNWGMPAKPYLPQNISNRTDVLTVRFLHSSSITTPGRKPSNLWTSRIYSLRPRVRSWIWIRCIQLATHRNTFILPLTLAMSTVKRNSAHTSSYFIPGQHFLETFMLLSHNNQDHSFMGHYIIPILNQQTRPLQHRTMHISLRLLAAKIPSQLHYYSLPSFLRDFQYKGTLYSGCH